MLGTASYLSRSMCKLNIITMTVSLAEGKNKATALLIFQVMAQYATYPVDVYKVIDTFLCVRHQAKMPNGLCFTKSLT